VHRRPGRLFALTVAIESHMRWMKVQLTVHSMLPASRWVGGNVVARGAYGLEIYSSSGKDFLKRNFGKDEFYGDSLPFFI
jgi:hypothetical protein